VLFISVLIFLRLYFGILNCFKSIEVKEGIEIAPKQLYIIGVGKRFETGYCEILEFFVRSGIVSISGFVTSCPRELKFGSQNFTSLSLEDFFRHKPKCDYIVNILPSKLKDIVNFRLMHLGYNVLSETPFARRPRQAKKLFKCVSNDHDLTILENAVFHPAIYSILELLEKNVVIKNVINRGEFIDYHAVTFSNIVKELTGITCKSDFYNVDRSFRRKFSDVIIITADDIQIVGNTTRNLPNGTNLLPVYELVGRRISDYFLLDYDFCSEFLGKLDHEQFSSLCLLFQILSEGSGLDIPLRSLRKHFQDFSDWRRSRRNYKSAPLISLKYLLLDYL